MHLHLEVEIYVNYRARTDGQTNQILKQLPFFPINFVEIYLKESFSNTNII